MYRQYRLEYSPEYHKCMENCQNPPNSYPYYECQFACTSIYPPRPNYYSSNPYSIPTTHAPMAPYLSGPPELPSACVMSCWKDESGFKHCDCFPIIV